jgi:hypothetical protein
MRHHYSFISPYFLLLLVRTSLGLLTAPVLAATLLCRLRRLAGHRIGLRGLACLLIRLVLLVLFLHDSVSCQQGGYVRVQPC